LLVLASALPLGAGYGGGIIDDTTQNPSTHSSSPKHSSFELQAGMQNASVEQTLSSGQSSFIEHATAQKYE